MTDKDGNQLATYTLLSACTPVGNRAPDCPEGWISVGYTQPGNCSIGNVPGDGPLDAWQMYGYNRVCKRRIPTSGDAGVDCCSNLFGISQSLECKSRGFNPYSWECNNVMTKRCNSNVGKSQFSPEWNGMPGGSDKPVYQGCTGRVDYRKGCQKPGCLDEFCVNYLRNAPPNNFFHDHDFSDVGHHFPRYSYTTPQFQENTWGYKPMRTPYKPYHDYSNKNSSNYCRQAPHECWNEFINNYHF